MPDKVKLSSFGGESSIRKSGSMGNKIVHTLILKLSNTGISLSFLHTVHA